MRRHPSLMPLSREHNHALLLAREAAHAVERGDAGRVRRVWAHLARVYEEEMARHFEVEEEFVLPLLRDTGRPDLADRIVREHRAMARCMEQPRLWDRCRLDAISEVLRLHVRLEERVVYPHIQAHAPEDLLLEVARTW